MSRGLDFGDFSYRICQSVICLGLRICWDLKCVWILGFWVEVLAGLHVLDLGFRV